MSHWMPARRALLAVLLLGFAAFAAAQTTYRWIDPRTGRVMVTDTPPPGDARAVSKIRDGGGGGSPEIPYATRLAARNFPVVLYTGPECEPCAKARELLGKRGIPFTEKSVQNENDAAELKALVGDAFVPSLKVGRQSLRGFDPEAYNNSLDLAGYPKPEPRPAE